MTVREKYKLNPIILTDADGVPTLWIEEHNGALTVVDAITSAKELLYRDEADLSIETIIHVHNLVCGIDQ